MAGIIAALTVACCVPVTGQMGALGTVRMELRVTPGRVPADGKTMARIDAEVRLSQGQPVPDGTQVAFRIQGGQLTQGGAGRQATMTMGTVRGFATVFATSTEVGTATVRADALGTGAYTEKRVYFVEGGTGAAVGTGVIHVRGCWVGYAYDADVVEARGENCQVLVGPLRIETDDIAQVTLGGLTVRATDVTVRVGEVSLSGERLYYDTGGGWGVLRCLGAAGVETVFFDGYSLEVIEPEEGLPEDAFRLSAAEAQLWYVARSISVYPYQKVVLRHARAYMGVKRLMKLPDYWVIAMPGYTGTTHSQLVGVNSEGEVAVEFPYFYRVTDDASGAIKLQHGATGASVVARPHWTLALEEAYDTGMAEGAVTVAGLPRDDWGMEWRDARMLGGAREGYFNVYSPEHKSVYADANVYEWAREYRLNLQARFDRPRGQGSSYSASADWLTHGRALERWNASYRLGTAVGVRHAAGYDDGLVGEHEVYAALDFARTNLGRRSSLTPTLSNLFAWDSSGYRYESLRGELRLRRIVSSQMSLGLSYEAQFTTGDYARGLEHVIGLDARWYHGSRLHSYLTGSYELPSEKANAYLLVDYYPHRKWRIGTGAMYYKLAETSYDDFEVMVMREVYGREVGLRWSEESHTVSLELGGLSTF